MSMRTEARKWTGVCDDGMRGRRVTRTARSPIFNIFPQLLRETIYTKVFLDLLSFHSSFQDTELATA